MFQGLGKAIDRLLRLDNSRLALPANESAQNQIDDGRSRLDATINRATGLGVYGKDKRLETLEYYEFLSYYDCSVLYSASNLARRIVDLLPNEATREWIELHIDEDLEAGVVDELDRLEVRDRFKDALTMARTFGGSGIYVALEDGLTPDTAVDLGRIKRVLSLNAFNRFQLQVYATDLETDLASPNFGKPLRYTLMLNMGSKNIMQKVHASRILRFDGAKLPTLLHERNNYWGAPVLANIKPQLRDFGAAYENCASIMNDARLAVLQVEKLFEKLADEDGKKALFDRVELINRIRSNFGILMVDKTDGFAFQNGSCQGIGELADRVKFWLQSCVDIPHTVLFGESPSGTLGPTGNSEKTDWYDYVKSQQPEIFGKNLNRLFSYLFAATRGPTAGKEPKKWEYKWRPLWQESTDEQLAAREKLAGIDEKYIGMGALDPMEVRKSRFGGTEFSIETTIDTTDDPTQEEEESDMETFSTDRIIKGIEELS